MNNRAVKILEDLLWVLIIVFATVLFCLVLYTADNKYNGSWPQAKNGVLDLREEPYDANTIIQLVEGWAYYSGRLLSPQDFQQNAVTPDRIVYIGQISGFESDSAEKSPHGSASYRMVLVLPDGEREYMLELPEIYSAYRLYINGRLVAVMGDPQADTYLPETGTRTVRFSASGQTEILLAVSDFTHFYSGVVYPPAFGHPEAMATQLNIRFLFRSLFTAFALSVGVLAVIIGILSGRNKLMLLFGLLCVCFVGYTAYPLWQMFAGDHRFLYALENASYYGLITLVILLQKLLHGNNDTGRWRIIQRATLVLGMFICGVCLVAPFFFSTGIIELLYGYSLLVMLYQWVAAAVISITAVLAIMDNAPYSRILMCGILVFNTTLIMDRLLPLHEPIVSGWFPELGSFVLVLCIGVSVGYEMALKYRDSAILRARARETERILEIQRAYYDMLTENIEDTKNARHDLRHHFMLISRLVENHDYEKLTEYVKQYGVAVEYDMVLQYADNDVVNLLLHHYTQLAHKHGILFEYQQSIKKKPGIAEVDLCAVLSNLLENAVEACLRQNSCRQMTLSIAQDESAIFIYLENSTDGKTKQQGSGFLSAKSEERTGYGLASIQSIAKRYAGEAQFEVNRESKQFKSTVLLFSDTSAKE